MRIDVHLVPDLLDAAFGIDDEAAPGDTHVLAAVQALLDPDPVGFEQFMVGVGQQREVQRILLHELRMALFVVGADAEYRDRELPEAGKIVAEGAGLARAAGRIVLRVEVQHVALALERGAVDDVAGVARQGEIRGLVAGLEHTVFLDGFGPGAKRGRRQGAKPSRYFAVGRVAQAKFALGGDGQALDRPLAPERLRPVGAGDHGAQCQWRMGARVARAPAPAMFVEAARDIGRCPGIEAAVEAFDEIDEPRHRVLPRLPDSLPGDAR